MRRSLRAVGLEPGQVVLTFDDGPNSEGNVTQNLLNVLHRHHVKAAFCVVGKQVEKHPNLVKRMHHSGHLLVNHTQNHVHPIRQNLPTLLQEIRQCDKAIGLALGQPNYQSQYFRSPFGIVTLSVRRAARQLGVIPALVSHYGWDTRVGPHNCSEVVDGLIAHARRCGGGMFVLHDGSLCPPRQVTTDWNRSTENRVWVPDAVDRIISELSADGMEFILPNAKQHTTVCQLSSAA